MARTLALKVTRHCQQRTRLLDEDIWCWKRDEDLKKDFLLLTALVEVYVPFVVASDEEKEVCRYWKELRHGRIIADVHCKGFFSFVIQKAVHTKRANIGCYTNKGFKSTPGNLSLEQS